MKNKPQKMEKVAMVSENIENENLQKLRAVFPQFVKDGSVDFDALQSFFRKEEILADDEKYGLSWAGKSNAFKAIRVPATGTLVPKEKESKDWDKTENVFIEGDNLEVLKLLQKHYRGQIKMIYIDPPYNTGKDFIYKDNFTENISDYYERTGQSQNGIKLTSNMESNGRYHSDWLTMMYPRLFLARNLLKDDGVIFVSIDDNEVANLRMIMDEIFGEENFVSQIIWRKKYGIQNDAKHFSTSHEYIICYAKNIEIWVPLLLERSEEQNSRYKNPDNDPRGVWASDNFTAGRITQKDIYEITTPTGKKYLPPTGSSWRFSKEKYQELLADNRVYFSQNGDGSPRLKRFLSEVQDGITPTTFWDYDEVGHTDSSKKALNELFGDNAYFDYPKPVELIKRIIKLSTKENDIILDFFAGSGTTAHAVMDLNAEDGGNRKFICVQIPEETDKDSEAHKAGYKTIAEISRERIRHAGDKIIQGETLDPQKGLSLDDLDIGFKAFSLSPSNYRRWNVLTAEDDEEVLLQQAKLFLEKPLVDKYDEQSVIYEILLKEGFDLNSKIAEMKKGAVAYHKIIDGEKEMTITFVAKLTIDQINSLELPKDTTFVCLDSALDDTTKVNIMRNLRVKTI